MPFFYENKDDYDANDGYDYTKKLFNYMLNYAKDENTHNFYTNSDKQIFTLYYLNEPSLNILEGGYYKKYLKYKQKYLSLKNLLK